MYYVKVLSEKYKNKYKNISGYFTKKRAAVFFSALLFLTGAFFLSFYAKTHTKEFAAKSLAVFEKVSRLLPIEPDTKKEIKVTNQLVEEFTKKDNQTKTFLILLQNNMELRPGGGFLGQYAILKIKNGEVISTFVEDANLLDQRIHAKIPAPYPFKRMMRIKKWKFRDSNFSSDFPTNAEKAEYFYGLARGKKDFDGVIAVNADVLNHILELTGPIQIPGYSTTFTSRDASIKLEDIVEKRYLANPELDSRNRKVILKKMASVIIEKLSSLKNISRLAKFAQEELRDKNIMLYFKDSNLQDLVQSVHWDGSVAQNWEKDYIMLVDANMGALKSDYYIRRSIDYEVDFTQEKPIATIKYLYRHTAPYGNWRTSDYHSYLRLYVPKGSNLIERKMVSYPLIDEDFGKTYFGFIVHVLINRETEALIKYELPDRITPDNYQLLIQKQSGINSIPVTIRLKTADGEITQQGELKKDLKFEMKK